MKSVILTKQYPLFPYYPAGTELYFVSEVQADDLVNKGIAKYIIDRKSDTENKELDMPNKDKMIRKRKTK